ncbi:MAG: hypothetical protein HY322_12935 [Betaproteobacteria bacterium]|nr:hypothetical protein [Betaproteobacteria bacterium]
MPSVDLFAEDNAHELFVLALLRRIMGAAGGSIHVNVRSAVGGHGRALTELRTYQRAVLRGTAGLTRPDLLVVVIDANCKGRVEARNDVLGETTAAAAGETMVACPDPHVERWFFADPEAFARVVGVDQQPGQRKCERARYKTMLRDAVSRAGHFPTLGGLEFAQDLVREIDLHRASRNEPSLGALIDGLRAFAQRVG